MPIHPPVIAEAEPHRGEAIRDLKRDQTPRLQPSQGNADVRCEGSDPFSDSFDEVPVRSGRSPMARIASTGMTGGYPPGAPWVLT
jgi:hypothetical protein